MKVNPKIGAVAALLVGIAFVVSFTGIGAQAQTAPRYFYDPGWPQQLPNKWKIGGITGLAVDKNDDVWVLNRPNDLTDIELHAELTPPAADCCVRPPSMIHIDKQGKVIGSFDAPQGHGMDVDSDGFVYLGQDTVRKYDPRTGRVVAEIARAPEREDGGAVGLQPANVRPGQGGRGPIRDLAPPAGAPADQRALRGHLRSRGAGARLQRPLARVEDHLEQALRARRAQQGPVAPAQDAGQRAHPVRRGVRGPGRRHQGRGVGRRRDGRGRRLSRTPAQPKTRWGREWCALRAVSHSRCAR